jgi:hypothetical protein
MKRKAYLCFFLLFLTGCAAYAGTLTKKNIYPKESKIDTYLLENNPDTYYYDSLSPEQKVWYQDIEDTLGFLGTDIRLTEGLGLSETNIAHIFTCVIADHPEIFWADGYTYTAYPDGVILFSGTYTLKEEIIKERQALLKEQTDKLLAGVSTSASDYEKARYVYDTVIDTVTYDEEALDSQNLYSALVRKSSVCTGYAKSVQYLLNKLGIPCTIICGTADGGAHAWNLACEDGEWYYIDATWGDKEVVSDPSSEVVFSPSLEVGSSPSSEETEDLNYFNMTSAEVDADHIPYDDIEVVKTKSVADNPYYVDGKFVEDVSAFLKTFDFKAASYPLTLKCASKEVLNSLIEELAGKQKLCKYLDITDFTYIINEQFCTVTFTL